MTDRVHSLTVVLKRDMRVDDVEDLVVAIKTMRNVLRVDTHVSDVDTHMAEERAKQDLSRKLWKVLHPDTPGL